MAKKPIEESAPGQANTDLESFLGVEPMEAEKVNEFARVDKLQVITLREMMIAEAFAMCLQPVSPMLDTAVYEHHKKQIEVVIAIAMDVATQVGKVYDEKFGPRSPG